MNKRIVSIATGVALIGLALYAAHSFDVLGLIRATHGR